MKTFLKRCFLFIITVSLLTACSQDEDIRPSSNKEQIIGCWVASTTNDSIRTYNKTIELPASSYGFEFKSENKFIERKNSGWCGTPPIAYANFDGTWELQDSLISIEVGYWGGIVDYQWHLISVDDKKLKIKIINVAFNNKESWSNP